MTTLLLPPDSLRPEVVDDVRRREFLGILAAAGLLAGCGQDGSERAGGTEADAAYPRTVAHGAGELRLDAPPSRVVLLAPVRVVLNELLAFGVTDVVAAHLPEGQPVPSWTEEVMRAEGIEPTNLPFLDTLDPELVLSLRPDLVIGTTVDREAFEVFERLEAAGLPLLYVPLDEGGDASRRERHRILGEAFDATEDVARVSSQERAALDAIDVPPGIGLSMFAAYEEDGVTVEVHNDTSPLGTLLRDLGFEVKEQPPTEDDWAYLAEETLGRLDTEVLVNLTTYGPASLLDDSAVFGAIPAVRGGRFVSLDYDESFALNFPSPLGVPTLARAVEKIVALAR